MCGIFAIFQDAATSEGALAAKTKAALEALHHRGPDGSKYWIADKNNVALGHTRLAIVGIASGTQPLSNRDGSVRLVLNGELYDWQRIRKDLQKRGHEFVTDCDSEVALRLYEEYGTACLEHMRGEFAFVLFDQNKNRLFAARDRFGIKPLCFSRQNGTLYLASEAKAIFAAGVEARWDSEQFFQSAASQYVLPDRTLFEGVNQLKPGHFLLAQEGGQTTIEPYWDLDYVRVGEVDQNPSAAREQELIEEFGRLLAESVELRLQADDSLSVCAHLSGGLDSSAVVGLAMQKASRPLKCFSISFRSGEKAQESAAGYDEEIIAAEMAAFAGGDFEPLAVSQEELLEVMPAAVYASEGFAVNNHLSAKYLLNKHIRKGGFKVALTGEGADEVVAGYPHLRSDLFKATGRGDLVAGLHARNTASSGIMLSHGQSLTLAAVEERLGYTPGFIEAKGSLGHKLCATLDDDFLDRQKGIDPYATMIGAIADKDQLTGRNRVDQSLYLWSKTALANYILRTLGDGMEMAHSVEGRLPFLDHHLFEFVRGLPLCMKIKGGERDFVEKYILRQAVKPVISKTIYEREKHPFVAPPLSRFADKKARTAVNDILRSKDFGAVPFFDQTKIIALLDSLPGLPESEQAALDPVLMTAMSATALQRGFKLS